MAEMVYTEQVSQLTAERLGDFARSVPSDALVKVSFETREVERQYSIVDEDFVTFKASF